MFTESRERSDKTPRERRRARRILAIRSAALELLVAEGLDGFSVQKLADRVDLTPGALYRYFDSRDEILISVQLDVLEVFGAYLRRILGRLADAPPLVRITTLCRAYMALDDLQPQRFRLIGRLVSDPDPLFSDEAARPAMMKTLELLGLLAGVITEAQTAGSLGGGDALKRAVLAWSSIQGVVERRKLTRMAPASLDASQLADELLRTLLVGWGAAENAARDAVAPPADATLFETVIQEIDP